MLLFLSLALASTSLASAAPLPLQPVAQAVKEVLEKNPGILVQAQENLMRTRYEEVHQEHLHALQKTLEQNASSFKTLKAPTVGQGQKVVFAFVSPYCVHCRALVKDIFNLAKENFQFKLFWVAYPGDLGDLIAAQALLAAAQLGKLEAFLNAMERRVNRLEEGDAFKIATSIGLNSQDFQKVFHSTEIKDQLEEIFKVQKKLQLDGFPALVYLKSGPAEKEKFKFISGRPQDLEMLRKELSE